MSASQDRSPDPLPRSLEQIQRWMQAVITHPGGVQPGMNATTARQHLDLDAAQLDEVLQPSRSLSSAARLEIYCRAYYARLLECLREQFPALVSVLGEETFDQFSLAYLQAYPSRSYTLHALGKNFAHFLEQTRPTAEMPSAAPEAQVFSDSQEQAGPRSEEATVPDWPDLLVDLAQLEWNINEVFDGPGAEGERLIDAKALEQIPQERWPHVKLEVVPCLRLLKLRFPLNDYYTAVRRGRAAAPPQPGECYLALTRRDYLVRRYPLQRAPYALLRSIEQGVSLDQAIEIAANENDAPYDNERFARDLQQWFFEWSAAGFFLALR